MINIKLNYGGAARTLSIGSRLLMDRSVSIFPIPFMRKLRSCTGMR